MSLLADEVPFDTLAVAIEVQPVKRTSHAAVYDAATDAPMCAEMRTLRIEHRDLPIGVSERDELVPHEREGRDFSDYDVARAEW
jgi:hypothetical protein